MLQNAGFEDIQITVKENGRDIVKDWIPGSGAENYVTSAYVTATKPRQAHGFRDGVFYGASAACWLGEIRRFPVSVCTVAVTDYNRLHRHPRHRTSRRMEIDVPPGVVSTPRVPTNYASASSGSTPPTA